MNDGGVRRHFIFFPLPSTPTRLHLTRCSCRSLCGKTTSASAKKFALPLVASLPPSLPFPYRPPPIKFVVMPRHSASLATSRLPEGGRAHEIPSISWGKLLLRASCPSHRPRWLGNFADGLILAPLGQFLLGRTFKNPFSSAAAHATCGADVTAAEGGRGSIGRERR